MYRIQKGSSRIEKDLVIDDKGNELNLHVSLSMKEMETRVAKAYEQMSISRAELQKNPASVESFGKSVIAFFETIFGEDQTKQLLEFYSSDYTTMLLDIIPFIQEEIMPDLKKLSEATKERMLAAAREYKKPFFMR